jgi:hypothetical protein
VQVFAPISLVIFVVLTGFCLMRESHKFLSTLSFLPLLILPTIFIFIFWVLWMFCGLMFHSIVQVFLFFFHFNFLSMYLFFFLPTYLPTYLICYLS